MISFRNDLDLNTLVGERITEAIQKGDPTHGWEGDPYICMTYSDSLGWRMYRVPDDETAYLIWQKKGTITKDEVIKFLVDRDSRRGYDAWEDMVTSNEKLTQAHEQEWQDHMREELVPRITHALKKDGVDI